MRAPSSPAESSAEAMMVMIEMRLFKAGTYIELLVLLLLVGSTFCVDDAFAAARRFVVVVLLWCLEVCGMDCKRDEGEHGYANREPDRVEEVNPILGIGHEGHHDKCAD